MKIWQIQKTQFKVADFINWQRHKELELTPIFQRRMVWKPGARSYLIDTILRGLPIPPIILREIPADLQTLKSRREVVDGQQRLRTVISFVAPDLIKDGNQVQVTISKSHNAELAGSTFTELSRSLQQVFLDYQFMVHIFPSDTDDREILEIFARMNATGYKLNNQELRNANFFGEFKTTAYDLAAEQLERWRSFKLFSEDQIARMGEVELTSELMIAVIAGVSEGSKRTLDRYYRENDDVFPKKAEVSRRFRMTMDVIENEIVELSRIPFEKKTLFYPLFCAMYLLLFGSAKLKSGARPNRLSKSDVTSVVSAGRRLHDGTAPEKILTLTQRRVSQAGVRSKIMKYLLANTSVDG